MASEQKYLVSDLGPNAEQLLKGPRPTSGSVLLHHLPSEESPSGAPVTPVIHVVLPDAAHRSKLAEGCNARAKLARFPTFSGHFHQGMDQNRRELGVLNVHRFQILVDQIHCFGCDPAGCTPADPLGLGPQSCGF